MESNCPVKGPFDVFQPHHGILLLLLSYFCNNDTRGYTFPPVRGLKGPEGWQAPLPTHRFRGLVILYQKLKNGWNSQKSVFFITRGSFQPTGSWAASCFLFTSGVPGPLRFSLPYNYTHSCTGFSAKSFHRSSDRVLCVPETSSSHPAPPVPLTFLYPIIIYIAALDFRPKVSTDVTHLSFSGNYDASSFAIFS